MHGLKKDTWMVLPNLMKPREMSAYATFLKAGSSKGHEDYKWNVFILFMSKGGITYLGLLQLKPW